MNRPEIWRMGTEQATDLITWNRRLRDVDLDKSFNQVYKYKHFLNKWATPKSVATAPAVPYWDQISTCRWWRALPENIQDFNPAYGHRTDTHKTDLRTNGTSRTRTDIDCYPASVELYPQRLRLGRRRRLHLQPVLGSGHGLFQLLEKIVESQDFGLVGQPRQPLSQESAEIDPPGA